MLSVEIQQSKGLMVNLCDINFHSVEGHNCEENAHFQGQK